LDIEVEALEREHWLVEFFEPLRRSRREARAPEGSRRTAVLTMVRDEAVFFPIWLRYYSRYFAPEDIHVLDHGTTDGSTDGDRFVRIPVTHRTVDHAWRLKAIQSAQRELLERYDNVLTVDADEIVAPDPNWGTLDVYLSGFQEEFVTCLGVEILHLPDREPPLDLSRPVLDQRRFWFVDSGYDKPALASAPTKWAVGFHGLEDGRRNIDPDLRLIHLHRMDYDLCRDRHLAWSDRKWSRKDLKHGWAAHNRIADDEEFERWYYEGSCFEESVEKIVLERIPERWRGLF
jgi:hypothetical protein